MLVVWEWTVRYFEVDDFIFPAPSGVATALMRGLFFYDVGGDVEGAADFMGLMKTSFYNHISHTLFEAIMGFFMGSIIGLGLGLAFMQSKWVEAIIMPYVVAFQTLPKLAIAPLFIIWFGYEVKSKIFLAGLVAFFPLLVNTMVGLKSATADQLDLMRSLSASRWQMFWKMQFPNALPFIFAGFEIAVVFSPARRDSGRVRRRGPVHVGRPRPVRSGNSAHADKLQQRHDGHVRHPGDPLGHGLGMHQVVRFVKKKVLFWAPETDKTMGA